VEFTIFRQGQVKEDAESRFVAEQLEDLSKFPNRLLGDLGEKLLGLTVALEGSFGLFTRHGNNP
jgi:hypothetical protein